MLSAEDRYSSAEPAHDDWFLWMVEDPADRRGESLGHSRESTPWQGVLNIAMPPGFRRR
jgi:hypothetical protein